MEDASTGHRIPADLLPDEGPSARPAPSPPAPAPTDAERARTVAADVRRAALATHALDPAGYPFASTVNVVVDAEGAPLTFVSTMAEHTRNLLKDARAGVLLAEEVAEGADALAQGRVTLLGDLERVEDPDARAAAREAFLAAHPSAFYVDYGDFAPYRLAVRAVRWVGGFGRMGWISPQEYAAAEPDPLRGAAAGAIAHLNEDHADAMLACVQALGGVPDATAATVTALDRHGLELVATTPGGRRPTRVAWADGPLDDPARLRAAAVALTRRARSAPAS
jgi:putative heme iron utilization protein